MRRHIVTKGSFYERLADHGHEIVSDEDFAALYAPSLERTGPDEDPVAVEPEVHRQHARQRAQRQPHAAKRRCGEKPE